MAKTTRSRHHIAHLTCAISCNEIQIYPIDANIKTASPLMTVNVSHVHPTSNSMTARAVAVLLHDLDQQVDDANSKREVEANG